MVLLLGVIYFFFKRSPLYQSVTLYIREIRWKGELSKKVKLLLVLPVVFAYFYSFSFGTLCTQWLVPAIAVTAAFVLYCLLRGSKDTLFMVIALLIFTILHWIVALAGCTGL